MYIESFVLRIVGIVFSFIPFCNILASIVCIVGLILGIVLLENKNKNNENKTKATWGIVLNSLGVIGWVWPLLLS